MGIIRNAANRKIKGRIGDTTYYVSMDRQIARQALNSSNYGESARRSPSQQGRRVLWANLVNFYKASKGWMPKAFESKSSKQTDYNRFMSANLAGARIALTKNQAAVGACVADAFIVSQGSLRSIQVNKHTNHWDTDIQIGTTEITDELTIGTFTAALLANNNWILEGDQISFVSYQQYTDAQTTPHLICTAYEVTLQRNSSELLRNYLPEFCASSNSEGVLSTGDDISTGGFAYILSRNIGGGRLQVSTQQLITNNDVMISQYSSAAAVQEAITSYGVDLDTFLDTGSVPVSVTEQPVYIASAGLAANQIAAGAVFTTKFSEMSTAGMFIKLSNSFDADLSKVEVFAYDADGNLRQSSRTFTSGFTFTRRSTDITLGGSSIGQMYPTDTLAKLVLTFGDGSVLVANFESGSQAAD